MYCGSTEHLNNLTQAFQNCKSNFMIILKACVMGINCFPERVEWLINQGAKSKVYDNLVIQT